MYTPTSVWATPSANVALVPGELHLWSADLDDPVRDVNEAGLLLSSDEWDRAQRFHFERDLHRFVVGRCLLRTILGGYLHCAADEIRFAYGKYGKPALRDQQLGLQFNVSHSASMAVYAVALDKALGVDVELVRDFPEIDLISARCFAAAEARVLRALPRPAKTAAFFTCWTRKEAYLKAVGAGIAHPLDMFAVSFLPGERPCLAWAANDPREVTRWSFEAFSFGERYVAAAAMEGTQPVVRYWRAPPMHGE